MKALTKTVAEKEAAAADETAVQTGQSLWSSDPEDEEDQEE